ncbi:hypothetical protein EVAR_8243_1 [Eumeta japonica]|uniref:Reverse transcriptase domain-containing protein n=1 Tax=Eumeta variegata TaxID=151549 RepID=A0A4C1TJ49_EUMVA|nr:hypothetical protein EVAR_8243_1 [Eumeta japonica]
MSGIHNINTRHKNDLGVHKTRRSKHAIDYNMSQLATYTDDTGIISRIRPNMINNEATLETKSEQFGLQVDSSKTKYLASKRILAPTWHIIVAGCKYDRE